MEYNKWPKILPPLTPDQEFINNDFHEHWQETLVKQSRYTLIEKFNQGYVVKHAPTDFLHTLEIGAGLGEHLKYENLSPTQTQNYVALELRENMAKRIAAAHPDIRTVTADCQENIPYADGHFDRILAIHVLEHLPNLPAAIQEMYRVCNKEKGVLSIVIPCEGGALYSFARKISAQRIFEKRYQQSYEWHIKREHINLPNEIIDELTPYFTITHKSFFPLFIPSIECNVCIGITLRPRV